ncbi:MAG TPA: hypothetical protein VMZ53_11050 [Kofleriaceae bacterium]|nr:hypothetical protein [Kofleriaceae bacterium]
MKRSAIAFLAMASLAACSGKSKNGSTTDGEGSGSAAIYAKKYVVSFGMTQAASSAEIFLQTTDETGKQISHPLGTFDGQCQVIKPAEDMKAVTGVSCTQTGSDHGIELDAVIIGGEIVVLKLETHVGVAPDPMARTEVTRIKAPVGSAVSPEG